MPCWYVSWPGSDPLMIKNTSSCSARIEFCQKSGHNLMSASVREELHMRMQSQSSKLDIHTHWISTRRGMVLFVKHSNHQRGGLNMKAQTCSNGSHLVAPSKHLKAFFRELSILSSSGIFHQLHYEENYGQSCNFFRVNLLQQLRAARDGVFYVKARSRANTEELCFGSGCFKITFCAFTGTSNMCSGEATFFKLITDYPDNCKDALANSQPDTYFRLLVPEDPEVHTHLIGAKRIIKEETDSDHSVSNSQIPLLRVCAPTCQVDDRRFLHQNGQRTNRGGRQIQVTKNSMKLRLDDIRKTIQEFLYDETKHLPEIDAYFDFVDDALIAKIMEWLKFQWFLISDDDRQRLLAKCCVCKKKRKARDDDDEPASSSKRRAP